MASVLEHQEDINAIGNFRLACKECLLSVMHLKKSKRYVASTIHRYRSMPQNPNKCQHHFIIIRL